MDQIRDLADPRLIDGCLYCGAPSETRDHVPSRVFLDQPFPTNLPVVPACWTCNNGFSRDEEYVACLIESLIVGSTEPSQIQRERVAEILSRSPSLRAMIESAKHVAEGHVVFEMHVPRLENVILKLARGHAAYELSTICREAPSHFNWRPIHTMAADDRESFDAPHIVEFLGEVGSRNTQRLSVVQVELISNSGELTTLDLFVNDWVAVQEGRYRYLAHSGREHIEVRIVIGEYLACSVSWDQ